MQSEITELTWIEEDVEWPLRELAAHSRFTEAELLELVECGALARAGRHALPALRAAARLRADFELDLRGVALAMVLLRRIEGLEAELSRRRSLAPLL